MSNFFAIVFQSRCNLGTQALQHPVLFESGIENDLAMDVARLRSIEFRASRYARWQLRTYTKLKDKITNDEAAAVVTAVAVPVAITASDDDSSS